MAPFIVDKNSDHSDSRSGAVAFQSLSKEYLVFTSWVKASVFSQRRISMQLVKMREDVCKLYRYLWTLQIKQLLKKA